MTSRPERRRGRPPRLAFETRILLLALLAGLPGAVATMLLLWAGDYSPKVQWTVGLFVGGLWIGVAFTLRERVVRPVQTFSNLLAALLEGDYSIRSRAARSDDALGLAMRELNSLGETLREQRMGALEASRLLRKVMEEIDVAIFTFDDEHRLRLVNRAGERLMSRPAERILGVGADELGLEGCLTGGTHRTEEATFAGGVGRYELRRTTFRQGGKPHQLLVLTDLSHTLREEERQAWKRLIRVLSHEINNSLAPIKSIAGSLRALIEREEKPEDLEEDLRAGLNVIAGRSESLGRFMGAYARLARLPAPTRAPLEVGQWIRRVARLEQRLPVQVQDGPDLVIRADGDQLDQLLINLVRNAVDAAAETGGGVAVSWGRRDGVVEVRVDDEGPGLPETTNLFVPFFTTKPNGSGIGLALSRQIAEAHGGSLVLENRAEGQGCRAVLRLPVEAAVVRSGG